MIKCTTIGAEPSESCREICVLGMTNKCEALKTWEIERLSDKERKDAELKLYRRIIKGLHKNRSTGRYTPHRAI